MAKVKLIKKPNYEVMVTNIKHGMVDKAMTNKRLAEISGITKPTLYKRFGYPETMTLKELMNFSRALGISAEDIVRGLEWK